MAIYEFYCPDNNRIYQFYARSLAQAALVPPCPDNPAFQMRRILSPFAVAARGGRGAGAEGPAGAEGGAGEPQDARMEAALGQMENEFAHVDESDPKAMGRVMRRMAELTGEPMEGQMEEAVRKLEEGADPESLDEGLGGAEEGEGGGERAPGEVRRGAGRRRRPQRAPERDPKLYDYP